MKLTRIEPRKALNKAFLKKKPLRSEIEVFKTNLITLLGKISDIEKRPKDESEEHLKNDLRDFLRDTYYRDTNAINTKDKKDLVIHLDKSTDSEVGVIIEAKRPSNLGEMVTKDDFNKKALHELILYYLHERYEVGNFQLKQLVITNINEWYIIDANHFDKHVYNNTKIKKLYNTKVSDNKNNPFFYSEIKKIVSEIEIEIPCVYFNIRDYDAILHNENKEDDKELIALHKILSPEHLLKLSFANDNNTLDKNFYSELLHIIGLTEIKDGSKKLIQRHKPENRNPGSLIENTIEQLDSLDKLSRLQNAKQFGETKEEQLFNIAMELTITWVNRILFLKLLEAQLISYHQGDKSYSFLSSDLIKDYDNLNSLFFQVLAKKTNERIDRVKNEFEKVPYLNSSLFEPTELEHDTLFVSQLEDSVNLPLLSATVIKDNHGKKQTGNKNALDYFFAFLDAYDFTSEGSDDIQEDNKTLINASVLGLIFEKINGYKDGSFYTPAYITMYMCRETIRKAVIQKFNETKNWNCNNFDELYDRIERKDSNDRKEANAIINSLKICDPAVGSGHFLVSALNEIIVIKSDLKILESLNGRNLNEYHFEIINDELFVSNENGKLVQYNPENKESQRIQETLFHEKQTIIENCLFGVDINPNSVKICRLRLWIELLKNAYYTEEKQLHTLPNIDINIKCGDSLISRFDLQDDLKDAFKGKEVKYNFSEYKKAVTDYKNSKSKEQKFEILEIINEVKNNFKSTITTKINKKVDEALLTYNLKEEQIKNYQLFGEKIKKAEKDLLNKFKSDADKALKEKESIVNNVIYQNAFEWRFEFPEVLDDKGNYIGFDVIIGNPPYGVSIKGKEREFLVNNLSRVPDYEIYYWFIDKSHKILKEKGLVSYIIPNTILFNVFAQNYRLELFEKWNINEILDCTDINIFEDATVRNIIFQFIKNDKNDNLVYRQTNDLGSFNELVSRENQVIHKNLIEKNNQNWGLIFKLSKEKISVVNKIKIDTRSLIEIFPETSQGLIAYDKYKGQSEETIKNRIFHTTIKSNPNHKKWLYGEDVVRYSVKWNEKEYVEYCDGIANPRDPKYFLGKRILIREITNPRIYASLTEEELYNDPSVLIIKDNNNSEYSIEVLLSILNSKLATFYHFNSSPKATKGSFPKILVYDINNFPLPNNINTDAKLKLEKYCSNILEIKNCDSSANTLDLDQKIDALVYDLYGLTEEEIEIVEGN